jgi:hypothetical protein
MDVTLESILALAEALDRRLDQIQAGVPLPTTPSVPPIPISPEETVIYDDMQEGIAVMDEDVVEPASVMSDYPTPPVVQEEDPYENKILSVTENFAEDLNTILNPPSED